MVTATQNPQSLFIALLSPQRAGPYIIKRDFVPDFERSLLCALDESYPEHTERSLALARVSDEGLRQTLDSLISGFLPLMQADVRAYHPEPFFDYQGRDHLIMMLRHDAAELSKEFASAYGDEYATIKRRFNERFDATCRYTPG